MGLVVVARRRWRRRPRRRDARHLRVRSLSFVSMIIVLLPFDFDVNKIRYLLARL
jgi:hypothetical protein